MKLKMGYKLIAKNSRTSKQPLISITGNYIRFSPWFRNNNIIKRYVLFYENDNGFLCMKFLDDKLLKFDLKPYENFPNNCLFY